MTTTDHDSSVTQSRFQISGWDGNLALANLGLALLTDLPDELVQKVPVGKQLTIQGCMTKDGIWVKPDTQFPVRILAHELGHAMCDHAQYIDTKIDRLFWEACEIEAEAVAKIVAEHFGLVEESEQSDFYLFTLGKLGQLVLLVGLPPEVQKKVQAAADKIIAAGLVTAMASAPELAVAA